MNKIRYKDRSHGLHERAIAALLAKVEDRPVGLPTLDEVARVIGEPPERLHDLYDDSCALLFTSIEQALILLMDQCTRAVVKVDPADPLAQFVALAEAYLNWTDQHRAEFRLLSDGHTNGLRQMPDLRRYGDSIADLMTRMMTRAQAEGHLHPREDIAMLVLLSRSFAYGLARMLVDGRLAEWHPDADPLTTAKALGRDFVTRIARGSKTSSAA